MNHQPTLSELRSRLQAPLHHPDLATMQHWGQEAMAWAVQHFVSLADQRIGSPAGRPHLEALLREPPPETGMSFPQLLAEFEQKVAPHALRVGHPRFLAFIPSAPSFVSVLGELLTAATNFFGGVWLEAAGPSEVELIVLDWFKQWLALPATARGVLTSGGSEANLTALVVARQRLAPEDRGRAVLYISDQRHSSIDRAAMVIGLLPEQLRRVPVDEHYRMETAQLAELCRQDRQAGRLPWAVVANAGSTNTGAVDPLNELADLCAKERLWLHVDAAYGWPVVLVPEGQASLHGIERADSVTLDPHKWFAQTFEAGGLLVRDGSLLPKTFAMRPDYMQDVEPAQEEINFADYGLALTRRFRALKIWLSIKCLGLGWFRQLVQRCLWLAEYAEQMLKANPCFEVLCPRQLSIVTFRAVTAGNHSEEELRRLNLRLVDHVLRSGRAFLSSTRLNARVALRMCFINWRTRAEDVDEVVRLLEAGIKQP